ncbi:MAG TPA: hypothetical protein VFO76_04585 [Candidatus Kapabacteria bacterium]|nr:hypothetical protein [Candidatus Kapabacteria bacterium]
MLYLRYRNSESDDWTEQSFTIRSLRLQSSSEDVTPCGCAAESPNETHYALLTSLPPVPQAGINDLLLFLLNYKQAEFRQTKHELYVEGEYVTTALSLLDVKMMRNVAEVSFRLAAPLSDIL